MPAGAKQGSSKRDTHFARKDLVVKHRSGVAEHADLYVLTAVFNPVRFRSRWKLYQDFKYMVEASGATLLTCEIAQDHREFVVTEPGNPHHVQLATTSELWVKERALNLLAQRLPLDWRYMACVDADVSFARSDWANETVQQFQHHRVLQLWSEAVDLGPDHQTIATHRSFVDMWLQHEPLPPVGDDDYYYAPAGPAKIKHHLWHPGFAHGFRRDAFDALGGLIDWAILGSADYHMMWSLVGMGEERLNQGIAGTYRSAVRRWQARAERYVQRDVGLVPGTLLHYWHGKKRDRQYRSRWQILVDTKFDPMTDLKDDYQGAHQLVVEDARQIELRDALRGYFRARNEDSVDV